MNQTERDIPLLIIFAKPLDKSPKSDYNGQSPISDFQVQGGAAMKFTQFNEEYNRLYKEEDSLYHRLARHFHLSSSAFWVLYTLEAAQKPLTQTELCGLLCFSKQTIHSAIQRLRDQGILCLRPGKGRNMHIHLTEAGRQLARERVLPAIRLEQAVFEALTPEESRELLRLTGKYLDLFRQKAEQYINEAKQG